MPATAPMAATRCCTIDTGDAQCWQLDPWRACSPLASGIAHDQPWQIGRDGRFALTLAIRATRTACSVTCTTWAGSRADDHPARQYRHRRMAGKPQRRAGWRWAISKAACSCSTCRPGRSGSCRRHAAARSPGSPSARTTPGLRRSPGMATPMPSTSASGNPLVAGQMQHDFVPQRVGSQSRQRLLLVSGGGQVYGPGGSDIALWRLPKPGPRAVRRTRIGIAPAPHGHAGRYPIGWSRATGLLASAGIDGQVRLWRLPLSPQAAGAGRAPDSGAAAVRWPRTWWTWNGTALRLVSPAGAGLDAMADTAAAARLRRTGRRRTHPGRHHRPGLRIYDAPHCTCAIRRCRCPPVRNACSPVRTARAWCSSLRQLRRRRASRSGCWCTTCAAADACRATAVLPGPLQHARVFGRPRPALVRRRAEGSATWVFATDALRRIGEYPHDRFQPVLWAAFARDQHDVLLVTRAPSDPAAWARTACCAGIRSPTSCARQRAGRQCGRWR